MKTKTMLIKSLFILVVFLVLLAVIKIYAYRDNAVAFGEIKELAIYDGNTGPGGGNKPQEKTEYDTYLEAYFSNLRQYFGANQVGSCGYVAIGMLLFYYDNYLTEDIISEEYDEQANIFTFFEGNKFESSPGVGHDLHNLYPVFDNNFTPRNEDYYQNYVLAEESTSFEAKLINIGVGLEIYDFNAEFPGATSPKDRVDILEKYIEDDVKTRIDGLKYDLITFSGKSAEVKEHIKREIDDGHPVIARVSGEDGSGNEISHACIAYAYEGDEIICHMGWKDAIRVFPKESGYTSFDVALSVDFYMEHTHTNNYKIVNNTYCYCDHRIITYKQTPHTFEYTLNDDVFPLTHTAECKYCDYSETVAHKYNVRYEQHNLENHTAYCACGESTLEAHFWQQYVPLLSIDGDKFAEAQAIEPNAAGGNIGDYVQCKYCNCRKKLGAGEIIIVPGNGIKKPEEEEE